MIIRKKPMYLLLALIACIGLFSVLHTQKNIGLSGNTVCSGGGLGFFGSLFGNLICSSSDTTVDNSLPITMALFLSESGQSNALGSGASPALNTTSLYAQNYYWNNTDLVALTETSTETQSSAYGNSLSFHETGRGSVHDRWPVGATSFTLLRPGTTNYNNAITEQSEAFSAYGANLCSGPLIWVHGETDAAARTSTAWYLNELLNLQSGWYASSTASLGASAMCRDTEQPLLYNQMANWTNGGEGAYYIAPDVAYAQYIGNVLYPTRLSLAYPAYIVPYQSDNEHYTNLGAELSGEYFAKVLSRFISGTTWTPLSPSSATCNGNVVTLNTQGGGGSTCLTFDTSTFAMKPNYGFTFRGATTSTPSSQVQSVAITGCNQIQITLDQACQSDGFIQYAWNAIPLAANPGRTSTAAYTAGGNVRNQDTSWVHSRLGYPLYDWMVAFERTLDSCTNCSTVPTYTFSNYYGIATSPTPVEFLSCGNIEDIGGTNHLTFAGVFRANTGSATWSSGQSVVFAQNATSNRTIDIRGTTNNRIQVYTPASVSDGSTVWTSATNAMTGETEEGIVVTYDGTGATNTERLHVYRCVTATCDDITTAGTFAGTVPSSLPATGRADSSFGASSAGGTVNIGVERRIGQVAVWSALSLSPAGVEEWWNGGRLIDPRTHASGTPQHYWPFQPDSGFRDVIGGKNCRPFGSATGTVPIFANRYVYSLPEAGEYVTFPGTGSSTANTAVTYDGWMRCSVAPTVGRNAFGRIGGGELRNSATTSQQLRPLFFTGTNSTTQRCYSTSDRYPSSITWRRFTVTFDEGQDPGASSTTEQRNQAMTDLYVDGSLADFDVCDNANIMSIPNDNSVGNYMFNESGDGTDGMACQYSNLAMYNRRLTASEIAAISFSTNRLNVTSSSSLSVWSGPFPGDTTSGWRNAVGIDGIVTGISNSSTDMIGFTGP